MKDTWNFNSDKYGIVDLVLNKNAALYDYIINTLHDEQQGDDHTRDLELVLSYNTAISRLMTELVRGDFGKVLTHALDTGVKLGVASLIIALQEGNVELDFLQRKPETPIIPNVDLLDKNYVDNFKKEFEVNAEDYASERNVGIAERKEALGLNAERKPPTKRKRGSDLARTLRENKNAREAASESEQPEIQPTEEAQDIEQPESSDDGDTPTTLSES